MADERSRSPRRDIVWVKVKDGNAVMIKLSQMEAPQNVFNLLEAVKQVEKRKLDAVDVGDLQLFQNERAKNVNTPCEQHVPSLTLWSTWVASRSLSMFFSLVRACVRLPWRHVFDSLW